MPITIETALQLHQRGDWEQAAQSYDEILADDPDHADALHLRGVLFLQTGDASQAARWIRRAIAMKPDAAFLHANLAEALRSLGEHDRAIDCLREASRLRPENPQPVDHVGLLLLMQGKVEAAAVAFREALRLDPGSATYHNHLGNALRLLGDGEGALAHFRRSVVLDPGSAESFSNLGQALLERGELSESLVHCREAVRLRPDSPEALNNLGNVLRALGQLAEAKGCYTKALRIEPGQATTWNNMGQALQGEGKPGDALTWYQAAIERVPGSARFHTHRASALAELEREDEAATSFETALGLDPSSIDACSGLAQLRNDQGRHTEALGLLRTAVGVRPDSTDAQVQLGALLAEVGELDTAEAHFRAALRLDPLNVAALVQLTDVCRERLPEPDLNAICRLLTDRELSPGNAAALHFGLARVLDAQAAYTLAAEHFNLANALRQKALTARGEVYRPELQQAFIDGLIAVHTPDFFDRVRGFGLESERPVFIFGLPRSGTTLVEQILASHSRVFGAGELKLVRDGFRALPSIMGRSEHPLACLPDLDQASAQTLAQGYLDRLAALDGEADRVTDKMPENFQSLGLIAALLPKATLIHCRRDPRDVGLSCWTTNFRGLPWAFDRDAITHYFAGYRRLMGHWRNVLPHEWLDVDYESLVADPEGVSRRIVSWCGLDWDPNCLAFHETRRPVRTASACQVRRPLYTGSVGRWRHYASDLGSWFEQLSS